MPVALDRHQLRPQIEVGSSLWVVNKMMAMTDVGTARERAVVSPRPPPSSHDPSTHILLPLSNCRVSLMVDEAAQLKDGSVTIALEEDVLGKSNKNTRYLNRDEEIDGQLPFLRPVGTRPPILKWSQLTRPH